MAAGRITTPSAVTNDGETGGDKLRRDKDYCNEGNSKGVPRIV